MCPNRYIRCSGLVIVVYFSQRSINSHSRIIDLWIVVNCRYSAVSLIEKPFTLAQESQSDLSSFGKIGPERFDDRDGHRHRLEGRTIHAGENDVAFCNQIDVALLVHFKSQC